MLSFSPSLSNPLHLLSQKQIAEAQTLAEACRRNLDLDAAISAPAPVYSHLPLCVLEAIWTRGTGADGVQKVVARYAQHAGLNDDTDAPAHTIADFIIQIERVGVGEFAASVLQNKQRTSASLDGVLKAEAVYRFALVLQAHHAQVVPDVPAKLRGNAVFERAALSVPGQGSGGSLKAFYRLCGAHELVKSDKGMQEFVQTALGRPVQTAEVQTLLMQACAVLQSDFPGVSPRVLDFALWRKARGASKPPAPEKPPKTPKPAETPQAEVPKAEPINAAPEPAAIVTAPPAQIAPAAETPDMEASYRVRLREIPADDRPRERLIQYGADVLSLGELLAILLRSGTQQQNVMELANHLLSQHGGLRGVAALSVHELSEIHGIGPAKAAQIKAAIEFGRRLVSASPEERTKISSPRDVYHQIGPALRDEPREHFIALLLDTKNGLLRQVTVSVGDLSSSLVHPREVFAPAVRYSAASLIVAHNHPSGDPSPSPEDIQVTARLVEAGDLLGITLLDHIIVGDARWVSLKEKGLM